MKIWNFTFLLLFIHAGHFGETANILGMLPYPFYGHFTSFMPIFEELAIRGHNVTLVSPFPQKSTIPNLTEIILPNAIEKILVSAPKNVLDWGTLSHQMFGMWQIGLDAAKTILEMEQVQSLINNKDMKFDLIMTETWCIHEQYVAFGHRFNAPVINLLSLFFFPRGAYLSGNHLPPSYVPVTLNFNFNDHMTFIERIQNTFLYYWDIMAANLYYLKLDALMREYLKYPGSENLPPLDEMLRSTSLTLMEHDPAIGYPAPFHKNVVLFTGVNIKEPDKLPEDLQKYMDENKDGVIYFSLGSFFSMSILQPHMQQAIISALRKLKYNIIIKLDDENIINTLSDKNNIKIKSWLPQRSILAHPNCKLFITHCGVHGTMEGVYHAVPMVGIPLLGDQRYNAKFIESNGLGIALDIHTITEEKILNSIEEVLTSPKYRDNAKRRSAIFRDNPMNVMDNVIYWIEYVIRHKGAPHLRPAVLDLHWYQYLMLDVIAFYLLLILCTIYIIKVAIALLFRCIACIFWREKSLKKDMKKSKRH